MDYELAPSLETGKLYKKTYKNREEFNVTGAYISRLTKYCQYKHKQKFPSMVQ
jgi:hypothetical protein